VEEEDVMAVVADATAAVVAAVALPEVVGDATVVAVVDAVAVMVDAVAVMVDAGVDAADVMVVAVGDAAAVAEG